MTDQKERDKVLKQSFSADKVPEDLDAIIIGSGIGGTYIYKNDIIALRKPNRNISLEKYFVKSIYINLIEL